MDDDQTFVARDLSHIERALEEVRKDLIGTLFSPGRKNDIYSS